MAWQYTLKELASIIGTTAPVDTVTFSGVSTDTRTLKPGEVFFALSGDRFDGDSFVDEALAKGAAAAVCAQSHDGSCLIVPDALPALQQFAKVHRSRLSLPVIAITGSCGKTTTKDLTAAVLGSKYRIVKTEGNLNNEIGCPLSLLRLDETTQAAVIEMGANHMGEIAALMDIAQPNEGAVTMVAPSHLEGFGSIENVARAKGELPAGLPGDGTFYMNTDDPWCVAMGKQFPGKVVGYGSRGSVVLRHLDFDEKGQLRLDIEPIGELRLPLACRAHAANVLLAVAIGVQHGVTAFQEPLSQASVNASRFNLYTLGPLEIIDDCYNANPASMEAALTALEDRVQPGNRMAALGDMLELGDHADQLHEALGHCAESHGVDRLFVYGPHATIVTDAARAAGVAVAEAFDDHAAMANAIAAAVQPGDCLLVKGSRGMKMETVIKHLKHQLDTD